ILRNDASPKLFRDAVYHEFTHSEQDFLVLRSVLDDMEMQGKGIDRNNLPRLLELKKKGFENLTPAEKAEIQPLADLWTGYRNKTGRGMSDERVAEVIEARERLRDSVAPGQGSHKLSPAERDRAERLAAGFKNPVRLDSTYQAALADIGVVRGALKHLT